nr:GGDEF domain-containing protein [Kineococcus vitellinus]
MRTAFTQVAQALVTSEAHRALREQARTDALTGLANRAAFTEALQRAASAPEAGFSVAFVDLDDFKLVNDARGHAAGDELLRTVAARLRAAVREGDVCARLGGDEFAVLLHGTDGASAGALAERFVTALAEPVALPGGSARVGASIGVAHRAPGEDAEQVVQHADVSMYAAKAAGKNQVRVFAA